MQGAHGRFESRLGLKNDSVLFVKRARPKLTNHLVRIHDTIKNRNVQVDEKSIRSLDVRRIFVSNEIVGSFLYLVFAVKSHSAKAFGKNQKLLAARQTPLDTCLIDVAMNTRSPGEKRDWDIHLFDCKLIGLDVLGAKRINKSQQQKA